jgi:acetylornithine deacetylase
MPPGGQVIVALTACEESGQGYNGLETLRPHLPPLNAALVGEPTSLQPCVAQKGLLILKVHAQGRSAHAARAHLGVNAILGAAADLQRLAGFELDRRHPVLGPSTFTVTMIEGGEARNMVPEHCTFWLDVRTTPAYTHEELHAMFEAYLDATVEVHSKRLIPVGTPPDARIVRACRKALPAAEPFGSATMSDWLFLHDLPVVKIGPGDSRLSHTADEHVEAAEVVEAVAAYKRIIQAYYQYAA